ncbi:hypothetical protein OESDEN_20544 [Oesophagostomum dentatum]|uniref:Uncharacterized protein n=1 Tax=Oesophagostomum dentatum TaxID=61180 RepID=A0A0B1S4D6_OESDE|nr:hypothetical protein OESDEN_20544 [Oesophagostomum dentatum]
MRSLCIVALFCLITWFSVSGYPSKNSFLSKFREEFNCEDACYATVVAGLDVDLRGTAQRLKAKRICEKSVSQYWDTPEGFCSKLIPALLKETKPPKGYQGTA